MKLQKILSYVVVFVFIAGVLSASESTRTRTPPPDRLDFSYDSTWSGRPLTPSESTVVSAAICSIRAAPPDSITYTDAAGSTRTVSCSTLADLLQRQLNAGTMEAETLNEDYAGGELNDEINISDDELSYAENTGDTDYLEELLVHEATHKGQPNNLPEAETEIPAYAAELAYKDSNGIDTTDADYRLAQSNLRQYRRIHEYNELKRRLEASWVTSWIVKYLPKEPPENWLLQSFQLGDTEENEFSLGPLEVTDMKVWENYFGPNLSLILLMGPHRDGGSHMTGFQFQDGLVMEPAPWWQMLYPPGFYSMSYSSEMQSYFIVDTLNHAIVQAPDFDGDRLPDGPIMGWAHFSQFPELLDMLSVTPTTHPLHGYGLIVNDCDEHYSRWIPMYDERPFLKDEDGVEGADISFPTMLYEFVNIQPRITEVWPWPGDMMCTVFGTWLHPIEVRTTDPTGTIMMEHLGTIELIGDVYAECALLRPLMEGEFIVAFDPISERRLRVPYEVKDPTPRELTIYYNSEDMLLTLDWLDVEGAGGYIVEESLDGEIWEEPGVFVDESEFIIPLQHVSEMLFRVRAVR